MPLIHFEEKMRYYGCFDVRLNVVVSLTNRSPEGGDIKGDQ